MKLIQSLEEDVYSYVSVVSDYEVEHEGCSQYETFLIARWSQYAVVGGWSGF